MSEPHPFTIASSPEKPNLEFFIRHLGDWSAKLPRTELLGHEVLVEGPYGTFAPLGHDDQPVVWVAGGVGITPFLAALDRSRTDTASTPTLLYAVRDVDDNPIVDRLRRAEADGRLHLHLFGPGTGRLSPADLDRLFPDGMANYHVALCGPAGLVQSMGDASRRRGAAEVETEDFDIRQGFGPDRSREIDDLVRTRPSLTWASSILSR